MDIYGDAYVDTDVHLEVGVQVDMIGYRYVEYDVYV